MKEKFFDVMKKQLDQKAAAEPHVSLYNSSDENVKNFIESIYGCNPIVHLNQLNQVLATNFSKLENIVKEKQTLLGEGTSTINYNRNILANVKSQIITLSNINTKEEESKLKETQVKLEKETSYNQELKQKYFSVSDSTKKLLQDITPKQVSFLLQKSLERNDTELFNLLSNSNFDVDFQNSDGETLLHSAIKYEHEVLIQKVLAKSPNPNIQDKYGDTPVHLAIKSQDFTLAKKLMTSETNVYLFEECPKDELYTAIGEGNLNAVKYLLNDSPIKNTLDLKAKYHGYTPLHYALLPSIFDTTDIIKYLLEECPRKNEFDITTKDKNGLNAIHHAACTGRGTILKFLFEECSQKHKVDVNARDDLNRTVFDLSSNITGFKYLLEECPQKNNININDTNHYGETKLHRAMKYGETNILEYLLIECPQRHLLDLNAKAAEGYTALHEGARNNNGYCIRFLLEGHSRKNEVDIQAKTNDGKTALDLASSQSTKEYLTPKFIFNCTVEYDNPILNHPELITKATKKFGVTILEKLINFGMQFMDTKEHKDSLEEICSGQNSFEDIIDMLGLESGNCHDHRDVPCFL